MSVILSTFVLSTAEAAKETFDRSKAKSELREKGSGKVSGKRDAASGLPTGKRQHKPMAVDDDCNGTDDNCKATDYNSSRSNKSLSSKLNNGDSDSLNDMSIKKKSGKAVVKGGNGLGNKPKGKATDYNSSRSNKADSVRQNGDDVHIRKKPGRAAEKIDKEKDERKKPLKHEK